MANCYVAGMQEPSSPSATTSPIFVVGCPRTGTTLVQSILAQHSGVSAFPESNALYYLAADLGLRSFWRDLPQRHLIKQRFLGALNRCGLTAGRSRRFRKEMTAFLHQLEADTLQHLLSRPMWTLHSAFTSFDQVLSALSEGKRWIEKSPKNLFILDYIDRYLPQALVVHVIRSGPANIASLRDAGLRYRDFRGHFGGADGVRTATAHWNQALRVSSRWQGHTRHFHLRHETLCQTPEQTVRALCQFLAIPFEASLLQYKPDRVLRPHEVWKQAGQTAIAPQPSRFHSALRPDEQAWVLRHALNPDDYLSCSGSQHAPSSGARYDPHRVSELRSS